MPLSALEYAVALPAVLFRQEFEVMRAADVHDCGNRACLLFSAGNAIRHSLDSRAVGLPDFQIVLRLLIVAADRYR